MTQPTGTPDDPFDLLIVGGGINGCGIARDAAGRGYGVCVAEMNDLASGTSSWSTKLIHGGLRYLEYYEFRLVREALKEREVLWGMAPHLIRPLRFVLPHQKGMRPAWLLRLGLFLYDHLGGRKALPGTRVLDLTEDVAGAPLKDGFRRAFEYSDCWVDDARLVILNARDAADRGAVIRPRTRVVATETEGALWRVDLAAAGTVPVPVYARAVINAAGPWVDRVLTGAAGQNDARNVRLVQGSHIVVRRMFTHDRAYFFQNPDGRLFFAIPYERDFTLIGTTDRDYDGEPGDARITAAEIDYLCDGASAYFRTPVTKADIVWTYSGVRPLYDDGTGAAQEATRDYVLKARGGGGSPGWIDIFGGKITTYRRLAEAVMLDVETLLGAKGPAWTAGAALPGGAFGRHGQAALIAEVRTRHPFVAEDHAARLVRLYGTRYDRILQQATAPADLGPRLGADLYAAEVAYLMDAEWARTAEDVLWRRTKRGLVFTAAEQEALTAFMAARTNGAA